MADAFEQEMNNWHLAKHIAVQVGGDIVVQKYVKYMIKKSLMKKVNQVATEKGVEKGIEMIARLQVKMGSQKMSKKVAQMVGMEWIRKFLIKKAARVAATAQLKWVPVIGQLTAGAISSMFMRWTAEDIRKMYGDLYFEQKRAEIYETFGQPVPDVKLDLTKTGWWPYRVWKMVALNTVTKKVIVKIDKNYGMRGNLQKAKDFYKAVAEKGFYLSSEQCDEIAVKMSIWDKDWYKDFKPGDL